MLHRINLIVVLEVTVVLVVHPVQVVALVLHQPVVLFRPGVFIPGVEDLLQVPDPWVRGQKDLVVLEDFQVGAGMVLAKATDALTVQIESLFMNAIRIGVEKRATMREDLTLMKEKKNFVGTRTTTKKTTIDKLAVILTGMLAFLCSCMERSGVAVTPCTNASVENQFNVSNVNQVDLLFVIDNSESMSEEQASLGVQLPRMIQVLASGDREQDGRVDFPPVKDLHVGVISTDMGTHGFSIRSCSLPLQGDDGVLMTRGNTSIEGCQNTYPAVQRFDPSVQGSDAQSFAFDVGCVARLGVNGCGIEQSLEATLKALAPRAETAYTKMGYQPPQFFGSPNATLGHGDGQNQGFLRDNSILVIVLVTDEDDCTALDSQLYNANSDRYRDTPLGLRCAFRKEALASTERFAKHLLSLRKNSDLFVFAGIVGVPADLTSNAKTLTEILSNPLMQERVDTENRDELVPSCNIPGRGRAFPPRRILETAQGIAEAGGTISIQSICQEDFTPAIDDVIEKIERVLTGACLPRRLQVTEQGKVKCKVTELLPEGMACLSDTGRVKVGEEFGRALCEVNQLSILDGNPSGQAVGWYYDQGSQEASMYCNLAGDATSVQRVAFYNTEPSPASRLRLSCLQDVENVLVTVPDGSKVLAGDFCTGEGSGSCVSVHPSLVCDPIDKLCSASCTTDADCTSQGLLGWVCDDRLLSSFRDNLPDTQRLICVNPICQ